VQIVATSKPAALPASVTVLPPATPIAIEPPAEVEDAEPQAEAEELDFLAIEPEPIAEQPAPAPVASKPEPKPEPQPEPARPLSPAEAAAKAKAEADRYIQKSTRPLSAIEQDLLNRLRNRPTTPQRAAIVWVGRDEADGRDPNRIGSEPR
jgi:hypothetical protein